MFTSYYIIKTVIIFDQSSNPTHSVTIEFIYQKIQHSLTKCREGGVEWSTKTLILE